MKSLDFEAFTKLDPGVVFLFQTDDPNALREEGLFRKGMSIVFEPDGRASDFYYRPLGPQCVPCWGEGKPEWGRDGEAIVLDSTETRWGEFDYNKRFLVMEREDLETIREDLQLCWESTPKEL